MYQVSTRLLNGKDELIALKRMKMCMLKRTFNLSRVMSEVKIMRQLLLYPTLFPIILFGFRVGNEFLIGMALSDKGDIYAIMETQPLDHKQQLYIAASMTEGLLYLKHLKIIHRDIKLSNVVVDGEGAVRICDFGLSCQANDPMLDRYHVGTPGYVSRYLFVCLLFS